MATSLHVAPPMRALAILCLSAVGSVGVSGCVERDPYNAYDVAAAKDFHMQQEAEATRHAPRDPNTTGASARSGAAKVTCRCDAEGGLHVTAPASAQVRVPEGAARDDAEAEITVEERAPGTPIRRTISLGYVGDAPLTQTPSRGGPWNAPDGVLPRHEHVEPRYPSVGFGYVPFYGGYGYGYAPAGYGRGGRTSSAGTDAPSGHNLHFAPHVSSSGVAGGGVRGVPSGRGAGVRGEPR